MLDLMKDYFLLESLGFEDYPEDIFAEQQDNIYRITKDGICYGLLKNMTFLTNEEITKIPYYKDSWSIRDLDDMLSSQLVDHISYLFEQDGFETIDRLNTEEKQVDLVVKKNDSSFFVEVKKKIVLKSFERIIQMRLSKAVILVTTTIVSDEDIQFAAASKVIVFDRRVLIGILKGRNKISNILKKHIEF